jgi:DNA processing protein
MSGRARPGACRTCLRRAWLVGSLAGHIEKVVDRSSPGSRAHELLALPDDRLAEAVARSRAGSFLGRAAAREPGRLLAAVNGARAWACCRHDELYPEGLADLSDSPATLFGRGDAALLGELGRNSAVTIVGSRRPSAYGRELATKLGREVASCGMAVVSGMAMGIDSCAHAGALETGGLTVAVLGTGVDVPYPPRCRRLYEEIVERGLVLAELPPGTTARRWMFPARNRIMAALGGMTVVVEARERSGSLITAEMAQQLGREVGAVPGRVGSSPAAGTNGLVHDGAALIRDAQDVLDALLGPGAGSGLRAATGPALVPELAAVLELVEGGAASPDALARGSGLTAGALASALVRLELEGYLRSDSAGRYERTALALPEREPVPD